MEKEQPEAPALGAFPRVDRSTVTVGNVSGESDEKAFWLSKTPLDRLEAGAVQLAWYTPGASDWALVPQAHLFTSPIPEPSVTLLMLAGLAAFGLSIRRRRS